MAQVTSSTLSDVLQYATNSIQLANLAVLLINLHVLKKMEIPLKKIEE